MALFWVGARRPSAWQRRQLHSCQWMPKKFGQVQNHCPDHKACSLMPSSGPHVTEKYDQLLLWLGSNCCCCAVCNANGPTQRLRIRAQRDKCIFIFSISKYSIGTNREGERIFLVLGFFLIFLNIIFCCPSPPCLTGLLRGFLTRQSRRSNTK